MKQKLNKQKNTQKCALVTGCNRGAGKGIAQSLLEEGYIVYGFNRTPPTINHPKYQNISCDMSNIESIKRAVSTLTQRTTQLSVLVHNAAIRRFGSVMELDVKGWDDSIKTNLNGVFYLTKLVLSLLVKSKGYCVIVGSHSEKYTFEGGSAYCSTKAGLRAFSECLLEEVRHKGVRVSYLSIGAIKNRDHGYDESWKLTPRDVGDFIVSLLSMNKRSLASYIDLRPSQPLHESKKGIEKLQYL